MSGRWAGMLGAVIVIGGCGGGGEAPPAADSNPAPRAERHSKDDRSRGPVILATADLGDGRRVLLRSARDAGGPCLTLIGLDKYVRQCGRAPSERVPSAAHKPIAAGPIAQLRPSAPFEVYGETSAKVDRVWVKYERDGVVHQTRATLLRVVDEKVLDAAGISKAFGYYFKELPPDASHVKAAAFGADGHPIGSDSYRTYGGASPRAFIAGGPYR